MTAEEHLTGADGGPAIPDAAWRPDRPDGELLAPLEGRLHPAAMLLLPLGQLPGLVGLIIFGGISGRGLAFAGVGIAFSLVAAVARWARFRWALEGTNLVIHQGLVQRSRRVIPAERVQAVDIVRPLAHRLLGVVRVDVEAIGGDDVEGRIEAIDAATAQAIADRLRQGRSGDHPADRPSGDLQQPDGTRSGPEVLATVAPRSLVIAGLTGGRVGVLAVIFGGLQQTAGNPFERLGDLAPMDLGALALVLLVAVGSVVVFGLSIIATVVAYWDFTVALDGDDLRITRGLATKRSETIPTGRIQALWIEQNLLRRLAGLASVRADVAGRAGGSDQGTGLLLPAAPLAEAEALVARLLAAEAPLTAELHPAPPRARRRYRNRALGFGVFLGVAAGVAVAFLGLPGSSAPPGVASAALLGVVVGVVAAGVGVPLGHAAWSAIGWAEVDDVIVVRRGVLVRRRVHLREDRVEETALQATPFQRRLDLADLHLGIPRSSGFGPAVPDLDAHTAADLSRRWASEPARR